MSGANQPTPGPWRIPGANVFRVVAPDAPHHNPSLAASVVYPWAIVCTVAPDSVGGAQAAANARLIASAPDLYAALVNLMRAVYDLDLEGDDFFNVGDALDTALDARLKAEGRPTPDEIALARLRGET